MPVAFVVSLAVSVVIVLALRPLLPAVPLRLAAAAMSVPEAFVAGLGVLGLAWHCGAMFYAPLVGSIHGTGAVIRAINAMGAASVIWYAVPALMLLAGLRRQHVVALTAVAVALLAVGGTMYDGGSLSSHLGANFVCVVVLAAVALLLIVPPWQRRSGPAAHKRPQA
ncbi:hypothetical protein IV498_10465 [Paenarthrobacter sp. Z7-10]|uniref:hypothetical protein n=1 Tax=Paenarthrobacter sp. Z7-10 TaxID=2787635 RepID=UPI0022A96932|nr:hypothetical protein [Paenarthrobacter sp. Z7-10]MCZ2403593.1 hypothetical protein [Paenarthrobacter sp. Z7-10]